MENVKKNGNEENNIASENHQRKKANFDKFFLNFEKEYKLIKKLTHQCQYKCFNTEKSTLREAELCARICLRPYMTLRDSNGKKVDNCDQNFKFSESKCLTTSKNPENLSECYRLVLNQHEECLKTILPSYQKNCKEAITDFEKFSKNEM